MRIGIVPFMNLKPLIAYYERRNDSHLEWIRRPPSGLYPLLEREELDVSFIASYDYLCHRDQLHLCRRFGVATRGSVASVLLLCRKPLCDVKQILVDERSRTSVNMLRVLLHHKFDLQPELVSGDVTGEPVTDAILVIGDRALKGYSGYEQMYDIGTEWTEWSGLPFIFGVWVSREERFLEPLEILLDEGWRWGRDNMSIIVREESRRTGLMPNLVQEYLQHNIQYELTPREFEGLDRFGELLSDLPQWQPSAREAKQS